MSRRPPVLRRAQPWIVGWLTFQAVVALTGWLTAWRKDEGDETSTSLRRTLTHNGLELRPVNAELFRVRIDLAMAGAAVDLTLRMLMAGAEVRVPADWRVWWRFRGVGGIGGDGVVARVHDERSADLRIHADVVLGGIGVAGV